jgi:hypothetical protein
MQFQTNIPFLFFDEERKRENKGKTKTEFVFFLVSGDFLSFSLYHQKTKR